VVVISKKKIKDRYQDAYSDTTPSKAGDLEELRDVFEASASYDFYPEVRGVRAWILKKVLWLTRLLSEKKQVGNFEKT